MATTGTPSPEQAEAQTRQVAAIGLAIGLKQLELKAVQQQQLHGEEAGSRASFRRRKRPFMPLARQLA